MRRQQTPARAPGLGLAVAFVLPAALLVLLLNYYPMLRAVIESLYSSSLFDPQPRFVGLENYRALMGTPAFWQVVVNSLVWTGAVVLLQNLVGLLTALLLDRPTPVQGLVRTLILLPWALPGVVGAVLWRFMYDPQLGLIDSLLVTLRLTPQPLAWLANPSTALPALIVATVWKGFPFSTVTLLAALQGVEREQLEAAAIDGAGPWGRFLHVTLPGIWPILKLNLLLTTIFTFGYFDMIWIATKGGPLGSTSIFPTKIFEVGFGQFNFGLAACYGVISVLILAAFAGLYLREVWGRE